MFNRSPRKQHSGVLAVLALLLVGVACDLDSHTAPPPEAPPEQPPVATAEELAFSPDAVYLVAGGLVRVLVVRLPDPRILDRHIPVAFETAEAFDLYIRSLPPHLPIEIADSPLEPIATYSKQDVVRVNALRTNAWGKKIEGALMRMRVEQK